MSFIGSTIFLIGLIAILFMVKHFVKLLTSIYRGQFDAKELAILVFNVIVFLGSFYSLVLFQEELEIKSSCARSAACYDQKN